MPPAHKNLKQGYYKVLNESKYIGDKNNIFYRSGWEKNFMIAVDKSPKVLKWGSEEFYIEYLCRVRGDVHRYFPDFYLEIIDGDVVRKLVIEIKPHSETIAPREPRGNLTRKKIQYVEALKTYNINLAKWDSAIKNCESRGIIFMIITERNASRFINQWLR